MPRTRATAFGLLALSLIWPLSACDDRANVASSPGPSTAATTRAAPAGNLCQRLVVVLPGRWRVAADPDDEVSIPVYDGCRIVNAADPKRPVWVDVSATFASKEDLRRSRAAYEDSYGQAVWVDTVQVGDGEGWGVHNKERSTAVFLSNARQIRLLRDGVKNDGGDEVFKELGEIAKVATTVSGGLPLMPARMTRPECEAGTAAAQRILGADATVRRGRLRPGGLLTCIWGSSAASVGTIAEGPHSFLADVFRSFTAPGVRDVRSVAIGDQGVYDLTNGVMFRIGRDRFVEVLGLPYNSVKQADLVALARAMESAYRG